MIYKNMEIANILDVKRVAKAGDSGEIWKKAATRDVDSLSAFSRADTADILAAGADVVVENVTQLITKINNTFYIIISVNEEINKIHRLHKRRCH